jgi:hypothetical protein
MPPVKAAPDAIAITAGILRQRRSMALQDLLAATKLPKPELAATLNHLAHSGQMISDLGAGVYRWRQIMPQALGEAEIGPENAELAASRTLIEQRRVSLEKKEVLASGTKFFSGKAESTPVEILLDGEDRIKRGKCLCGHFKTYGLRNGPCRHMLALRMFVSGGGEISGGTWDQRLKRMFGA